MGEMRVIGGIGEERKKRGGQKFNGPVCLLRRQAGKTTPAKIFIQYNF
jgi:hypothetical protein